MSLSASGKKIADLLPPLVVGILFLVGWEACCWIFRIPSYLVPSPTLDRQDLRRQCAGAAACALGYVARHVDRAGAVDRHRHCDRVSVRAEPDHRAQLLSLCRHPSGHADRRDCAADHHSGEEHPRRADHLRHHHRDLSRSSRTPPSVCAASMPDTRICSPSTARRVCRISSICGFRARCRTSSPACGYPAASL